MGPKVKLPGQYGTVESDADKLKRWAATPPHDVDAWLKEKARLDALYPTKSKPLSMGPHCSQITGQAFWVATWEQARLVKQELFRRRQTKQSIRVLGLKILQCVNESSY